jgi:6-phosphogluconolactonase
MHPMLSTHPLTRRDFLKGGTMGAAAFAAGRFGVAPRRAEIRAYVGTYTEGTGSEGLYHCLFHPATGALRIEGVTKGVRNPSFLAFHPSGGTLYAVEEVDDLGTDRSGGVVAYAIDAASGRLRERNRAESGGAHPAHVSVHRGGRQVLVANYTGATVSVLTLDRAGALVGAPRVARHEWVGPVRPGQDAPHPHSVYPVGRRVYVADLGLDRIIAYRLHGTRGGSLVPLPEASLSLRPGDGPRHLAFHPRPRFAYVINELSSTITSLRVEPTTGALHVTGTVSTLPEGYTGKSYCADIHVHPNGRYVYGSNRGHDSIVVAEVSAETGTLTVVQHHPTGGSWPRNFALDPGGRFLLVENQRGGNVVTLAIDPATGRLSATGQVLRLPAPVCLLFAPTA